VTPLSLIRPLTLTLSRKRERGLLAAALLASCAHTPRLSPEDVSGLLALPVVGPVAFDPSRTGGKVVLIDFFATWCFPCLEDMPNLEELHKRYNERGLEVLAVGMDREGAVVLEPFANHYQFRFPVLVANDPIRDGASPFGPIRVLPSTVLIGRDGRIIAAYSGIADPQQLRQLVERALSD
jgi:thiol-disulfide isomerase/thioredoxin